jgi:hypothetical protein
LWRLICRSQVEDDSCQCADLTSVENCINLTWLELQCPVDCRR